MYVCVCLSVVAPLVPKRKPKGGWKYGKPGRRGRPYKKLGKGGMNAAGIKRRGRPPKEKGQSDGSYIDSPASQGKAMENENSGEFFCLSTFSLPQCWSLSSRKSPVHAHHCN